MDLDVAFITPAVGWDSGGKAWRQLRCQREAYNQMRERSERYGQMEPIRLVGNRTLPIGCPPEAREDICNMDVWHAQIAVDMPVSWLSIGASAASLSTQSSQPAR